MSYSAAVAKNISTSSNVERGDGRHHDTSPARRPLSPSQVSRTDTTEESVYVLTLLTDKAHHERMTELRRKYFPKRLNKLAAHLTLFHALPGSKLEENVLPALEQIVRKTSPFSVVADQPFRLKKGFAISISAQDGGQQGKEIHRDLRDHWMQDGFLSDQDAGGCRLHYTLMNKVDDEVVISKAYEELTGSWKPDSGTAQGLVLWKYDRGFWRWEHKFDFEA